jgi:hypothetical protein
MKVRDLIKELKNYHPDAEVLIQIDSEGNGYNPLSWTDEANFDDEDGQVYFLDWEAGDCCMDDEEYEDMRKLPLAVVLGP